ncbi:hypothetical protein AVEN_209082-1, partial [Araneus ventricosus]
EYGKSSQIKNECQVSNISMEKEEQFREHGHHIVGPKTSFYSKIELERNRHNSEVEGLESLVNFFFLFSPHPQLTTVESPYNEVSLQRISPYNEIFNRNVK